MFDSLHLFLWQASLILLAGIGFYAWVRLFVEKAVDGRRLRAVAAEMASSTGIFSAALLLLWFAGTKLGAAAGYGRGLVHAADALEGIVGADAIRPSPLTPESIWVEGFTPYYMAWASCVTLFLATPRVRWARRARAAALAAAPGAFLLQAIFLAVGSPYLRSGAPVQITLFDALAFYGAPFFVWFLWARGSWRLPEAATCSRCGRRSRDIAAHVQRAHPQEHRKSA